jgi:hypothetical protein
MGPQPINLQYPFVTTLFLALKVKKFRLKPIKGDPYTSIRNGQKTGGLIAQTDTKYMTALAGMDLGAPIIEAISAGSFSLA